MNNVVQFIGWFVAVEVIGWVTFPITFRFFPKLASKGYAFTKPLSLLLWGYFFWLLGSLGILQNNLGGQWVALLILLVISAVSFYGKRQEIGSWIRENWKTILIVEIVFVVFFGLWAIVRAANPDITYTEKPMELAFINSILASPTFPPRDPWLSGYAISYYYFGYVLIAMLIRITGVQASIGYNLTAALWFGLTATASFGMVYDIIAFWRREKEQAPGGFFSEASKTFARWAGILGSFFVLLVSNVEGLLDVLHSAGVFWQKQADGSLASKFWTWLGILDLNTAPIQPFSWLPNRNWVWWRGSRVLQDLTSSGAQIEVIDEFPFFSYLLSDLHPHVLAMPFDLMAMGICLNLFVSGSEGFWPEWHISAWFKKWEFWLTALVLGSMAFFNTWDFPIYVGLFCLVWVYLKIKKVGWSGRRVLDIILAGLTYGVTGFVLFLPFFLSFKSQAGGLLPSMEFMTRGVHFWVMFVPLLIPIIVWCIYEWKHTDSKDKWSGGLKISLSVITVLWLLSTLVGLLFFTAYPLGTQLSASTNSFLVSLGNKLMAAGSAFDSLHGTSDGNSVVLLSITRRLTMPGTWLTLTLMLFLLWGLFSDRVQPEKEIQVHPENLNEIHKTIRPAVFVGFLVLIGLLLTLFPEYFYLRDQFGWRMNTIFKFYFQTWMFWGIAAACATTILWQELKSWRRGLFTFIWVAVILSGLVYTSIMLVNKTNGFKPQQWTLDGNAYMKTTAPDEVLAIDWLKTQPEGVVAEAVGGSYTQYASVSEQTGYPTVLGWIGHELQWRGGTAEMGSREQDIKTIYETGNWLDALTLIEKYDIRYIYVGSLEATSYKVTLNKFNQNLNLVYQNQTVTIFEVPDEYLR